MYRARSILVLVFLFCASAVQAHESIIYPDARDGVVKLSGYTRLSTEIPPAQKELLSAVVEYRFPRHVITVEQALREVLGGSGFALAEPEVSDPNLPVLLRAPLPRIQRHMGPARIDEILEAIAGPAWVLVVDPLHRLVSFELKKEFWPCGFQPEGGNECRP